MRLPILQLSCRIFFFAKASHHTGLSAPLQRWFGSLRLLTFPKIKIAIEREEICECDGHTAHKLSQRRLTADWLASRESDCSRTHSKVCSDWLSGYIKATRPVLEIFKMAGCFTDSTSIKILRSLVRSTRYFDVIHVTNFVRDCSLRKLYCAWQWNVNNCLQLWLYSEYCFWSFEEEKSSLETVEICTGSGQGLRAGARRSSKKQFSSMGLVQKIKIKPYTKLMFIGTCIILIVE